MTEPVGVDAAIERLHIACEIWRTRASTTAAVQARPDTIMMLARDVQNVLTEVQRLRTSCMP